MELRDYQLECYNKIFELSNTNENNRQICYLATGLGKTIIMASVVSNLYINNKRSLIVVDQEELVEQTIDKIMKYNNDITRENLGIVKGAVRELDRKIIVATRQTLTSKRNKTLDDLTKYGKFDIVFVDECHRGLKQVEKILGIVDKDIPIIGLTATPFNQKLTDVFDGFLYEKGILDSIKQGYLCDIKYKSKITDVSLDKVRISCGEFNQKDLDKYINIKTRNQSVVDAYLKNRKDRKHTIVYCTSIEHSNNVAELFNENGINASSLDSSLDGKDRKEVLKKFKNGEIEVLTNVNILTTGFDFPQLDLIIFARPTKSQILYTQALGRGLRTSEGKENLLLIDLVDNYKNNSLVNMESIFDIKDGELLTEVEENRKKEIEKELEKERRKELLQIEEDIKRFSSSVMNILSESSLDWFLGNVNNKNVAILMANADIVYYVFKDEDTCYLYKNTKVDKYKWELDEIMEDDNLYEILNTVESLAIEEGSGFIYKRPRWKKEPATQNQLKYIKEKDKSRMKNTTKWDVSKYFEKRNCWFALKEIIGINN